MELFKQISVDWLSKRFLFIGFSLLLLIVGGASYYMRGGLTYGIDFTGGTIILMKFNETPDLDLIRESLKSETRTPPLIQQYDAPSKNMVQIRLQSAVEEDEDLEAGRDRLLAVLREVFDPEHVGSNLHDFNNIGLDDVYMDFAGCFHEEHKIHKSLAGLEAGQRVVFHRNDRGIEIHNDDGDCMARLSKKGVEKWSGRLDRVCELRVVALLRRDRDDPQGDFLKRVKADRWEIPVFEAVYSAGL